MTMRHVAMFGWTVLTFTSFSYVCRVRGEKLSEREDLVKVEVELMFMVCEYRGTFFFYMLVW